MTTFDERVAYHKRARRAVREQFERFAFESHEYGAEFAPGLSELLQHQDDRCSLMMRFRPDEISVRPKVCSVLCEVKAMPEKKDPRDYSTFIMEARSFYALRQWNVGGDIAMLAYHSLLLGHTYASWLSDVSTPSAVYVPRRGDYSEQCAAMQRLFPDAVMHPKDTWGGGAGTPYIFVPKASFVDLPDFINTELLGIDTGEHTPQLFA